VCFSIRWINRKRRFELTLGTLQEIQLRGDDAEIVATAGILRVEGEPFSKEAIASFQRSCLK
jgi:hypothetical protein